MTFRRSVCGPFYALIALAVSAVPLLPAPAGAWGEDGHWIVCELGYRQLSDEARAEVDRLVALHPDADSFAEGCHWPDRPRKRATEHYVNYDRAVVEIGPTTEPANDPNVVTAIIEDAVRLGDGDLSDEDRADALLFLGHWVGDIHQPMHVSFADDRGGNSIGKRGTCRARNLHGVWDTCLVQRGAMGLTSGESRLDGVRATARRRIVDRLEKAMPGTDGAAATLPPWAIAAESYRIVTHPSVGYCVREGETGPCAYEPGNLHLDDGEDEKTIEIDEGYTERMAPVVEESLLYAAARLAVLIEAAL